MFVNFDCIVLYYKKPRVHSFELPIGNTSPINKKILLNFWGVVLSIIEW